MAKRSREDFEPSSPETSITGASSTPVQTVLHSSGFESHPTNPKIIQLDPNSGEATQAIEMRCSLPGHRQTLTFSTFEDYDVHYAKVHVNRCLECRKNFPTEHFLNLHIEENHDALVSVRRERGEKTYACFVEECDRKCSTPQKRRMHVIDKHMFPKDYDFYVVNDGIDRRSSMLRSGRHTSRSSAARHATGIEVRARQRSSNLETVNAAKEHACPGDEETGTSEEESFANASSSSMASNVDGLASAMSALTFIPPSVRFGRGGGRARGGFSRS